MAGKAGRQQRGRSGEFPPDKVVRVIVPLRPGDPLRAKYEALVNGMGVSGAEVVRYALRALEVAENGRPAGWTPEEIATAS